LRVARLCETLIVKSKLGLTGSEYSLRPSSGSPTHWS